MCRFVNPARVVALAIAPLAALLLTGCGGSVEVSIGGQTINNEDLAAELRAQIAAEAGAPPRCVDCPSGIEPEVGEEFDCTGVSPNGQEFIIEVTLSDDEGCFDAFVPPGQFTPSPDQTPQ